MKEYKATVDKAMDEGSKSVEHSYAAYSAVLEALKVSLEDGYVHHGHAALAIF